METVRCLLYKFLNDTLELRSVSGKSFSIGWYDRDFSRKNGLQTHILIEFIS